MEIHKSMKRKEQEPNDDLFSKKLSVLLMENMIHFNIKDDFHLKRLISQLSGVSVDEMPTSSAMLYNINEMYNNYQAYFKQFFQKNKDRSYCLTLHKWNSKEQYIFFHIQYMDHAFNFYEFPLGLYKSGDFEGDTDLALVRNTILHDLAGQIAFITTNFELDMKARNIVSFIFGEDKENMPDISWDLNVQVDYNGKVLMCFNSFIIQSYYCFLKGFGKYPELESICHENISSSSKIEKMFYLIVKESASAILEVDYSSVKACFKDIKPAQKYHLSELKSENIIFIIKGIVSLKASLSENIISLLTPYQWQLLEFLCYISLITFKLLVKQDRSPTSHSLLQYIKYELFLFNQMFENFPKKYNLLSRGIYKLFEEFFVKIDSYHKDISEKSAIQVATYLSPNTRKFLKASEIQNIRSSVFHKPPSNKDMTLIDDESLNFLDGIVMDTFDCSGNLNNECFKFESIPSKGNSELLPFWKKHSSDFPNLAAVARKILPIQTNTDRGFNKLKDNFDIIQAQLKSVGDICRIESFCFIYSLSQEIDLIAMDAKNFDLNIENFQYRHLNIPKPIKLGEITSKDIRLPIEET